MTLMLCDFPRTDFKVIDFKSKTMEDYDVEIKISYCGVCGCVFSLYIAVFN